MLLSTIFEKLALGELSQHKYGKDGAIATTDYPAIINHLNLALTDLHKELPVNIKELQIQQFSSINIYFLDYLYAVSNTQSTATKYIIDTEEDPFIEDVLRIDSVYDDNGLPVPLNDEHVDRSVFTAGYNAIQIPYAVDGLNIFVIYRASHEKIATNADPLTTEIYIPDSLEEPLLAYIAARCYSSLNNQVGNSTSAFYFNKYNAYLDKVRDKNILNETRTTTNLKLLQKGFV